MAKTALTTTKKTDSQSHDEAHAFKSQFEEINLILAKWTEYSTSSRANYHYSNNNISGSNSNHHHRFQGGRGAANITTSQLPLLTTTQTTSQRRISHDSPIFTHSRTGSYPTFTTPRQRVLRHQRSSSSLSGISQFHHLTNNHNHVQPHHQYQQNSSRSSLNYDNIHAQESNDFLLDYHLSDSKSVGNGDRLLWEPLSTTTLHPGDVVYNNDSFIPMPKNHHHPAYSHEISYSPPSLLNDDELLQKQLQLQAQKDLLDNAIAANRKLMNETTHGQLSSSPSSSLSQPLCDISSKYNQTANTNLSSSRKTSLMNFPISGSSHLSPYPDVNNQGEAGTMRKDYQKSSGRSTPNSSLSSSNPSSSGFSLFAQSPTFSLNPNNGPHRKQNSVNSHQNHNDNFSSFGAFPLTPVSTPPNDDEDGYFSSSYFSNKSGCTMLNTPICTISRGPIISSPVQESEEESFSWNIVNKNDEEASSSEPFDQQKSYSSAPGDVELDRYHARSAALNRSRIEKESLSNLDRFSHNRSSRISTSTPSSSTLDGLPASSSIMGRRYSESFLRLAFGNSLPTHQEIQDNNQHLSSLLDEGFGNGTGENQKQHSYQQLNRENSYTNDDKSKRSKPSFYYDNPYYLKDSTSTFFTDINDSNTTNSNSNLMRTLCTSGLKTTMKMRNPPPQQEKQEQNPVENMLPMFYYEQKSGGNDDISIDSQQLLASYGIQPPPQQQHQHYPQRHRRHASMNSSTNNLRLGLEVVV
ncbi:8141_t:CDS:2 [Ambispora gerdemannii]|uniref:8141_t:CDS:1 n=1 Tax=Ambispora gerdemannii TaxID=144530 RepID=A0A9N9CT23_9GLOM|nr:8141_t:CDS:2 [Ambispora gerdemannii]